MTSIFKDVWENCPKQNYNPGVNSFKIEKNYY